MRENPKQKWMMNRGAPHDFGSLRIWAIGISLVDLKSIKKIMGITCSFESSKIHRIQDTESDRDLLNWQVNTARLHNCPGGKLAVGNSKLHQNLGWYKKYRIPMNRTFSV